MPVTQGQVVALQAGDLVLVDWGGAIGLFRAGYVMAVGQDDSPIIIFAVWLISFQGTVARVVLLNAPGPDSKS